MTRRTADTGTEVVELHRDYERKFYVSPKKAAEVILEEFYVAPGSRVERGQTRVVRYTATDDGRGGDLTEVVRAAVLALPERPAPVPHPLDLRFEFTRELDSAYDAWMKADREWQKNSIATIEKELDLR